MGIAKQRGTLAQRIEQAKQREEDIQKEISDMEIVQEMISKKQAGYVAHMIEQYFVDADARKFGVPISSDPS